MKVVVYLPARDERSLSEEGHDPAKWVREVVKTALEIRDGALPQIITPEAKTAIERGEPVTVIHEIADGKETALRVKVGKAVDDLCTHRASHARVIRDGEACKGCGGTTW